MTHDRVARGVRLGAREGADAVDEACRRVGAARRRAPRSGPGAVRAPTARRDARARGARDVGAPTRGPSTARRRGSGRRAPSTARARASCATTCAADARGGPGSTGRARRGRARHRAPRAGRTRRPSTRSARLAARAGARVEDRLPVLVSCSTASHRDRSPAATASRPTNSTTSRLGHQIDPARFDSDLGEHSEFAPAKRPKTASPIRPSRSVTTPAEPTTSGGWRAHGNAGHASNPIHRTLSARAATRAVIRALSRVNRGSLRPDRQARSGITNAGAATYSGAAGMSSASRRGNKPGSARWTVRPRADREPWRQGYEVGGCKDPRITPGSMGR